MKSWAANIHLLEKIHVLLEKESEFLEKQGTLLAMHTDLLEFFQIASKKTASLY